MRKMITCSFDEVGVRMTAWNGIHPDRVGSFSATIEMNRTRFNEACQNKMIFGEMLGINIAEGWQNALSDAVKNASPLKIDFLAASKVLVEKITERFVTEHGQEEGMKKAEAFFNSVDMETEATEDLIKKAMIAVAEKSEAQPAEGDTLVGQPNENKMSDEEWAQLESLCADLKKLDPNWERTGLETIEEIIGMINAINAKDYPTPVTPVDAEPAPQTTEGSEDERSGNSEPREEKSAKSSKKSRSKTSA